MINIGFFGNTSNFLFDAFDDAEIVSLNSTRVTLRDSTSGFVTSITGTNFSRDTTVDIGFRGTVTGFSTATGGGEAVVRITGLSASAATFGSAIQGWLDDGENALAPLFNTDDVTLNASTANRALDLRDFFEGVTTKVTILGSPFGGTLEGTQVTDIFLSQVNRGAEDFIFASAGNDVIDLRGADANGQVEITYASAAGIDAILRPGGNASVTKRGFGTDQILDWTFNKGGFGNFTLDGSKGDDTYAINGGAGSYVTLTPAGGNDRIDVTLSGGVRLAYDYSSGGLANQGAVINLSTGVVSNDGRGGRDQINVTDGPGNMEIRGTYFNDVITGSARNEQFVLMAGNDTLNAGAGSDTLRYDQSNVTGGVKVDLAAGTATGTFAGQAFLHRLTGVEVVSGSSGNDVLRGGMNNNSLYGLFGNEGNDSLYGGAGTDFLAGGSGNDYLNPGDNTNYDEINPHTGNDTVDLRGMVTGYAEVHHFNLVDAGPQRITVNGQANTASINKGANGLTTIVDGQGAMQAGGLGILGSNRNDTVTATVAPGGVLSLAGGRGDDSYTLDSRGGLIRIDLSRDGQYQSATQGAVVDLGMGVIRNDGFGFRDTITMQPNGAVEVRGTDLSDVMIGRGGQDTFDGGAGDDRILYDRIEMTSGATLNLDTGKATGTWKNAAFQNTLIDIEDAVGSRFADSFKGSMEGNALDARGGNDFLYGDGIQATETGGLAGQVYRMYQATLDRAPDAGGYEGWVTALFEGKLTLPQMATGFVRSAEFQNTYGTLDNAGFVNLLYRNVLDRDGDAAGVQGWLDAIAGGTSRAEVVIGFSQSVEFQQDIAPSAVSFALSQSETHWTDEIYRVYRATLDRDPDLGGFKGWAELLGSGTDFNAMIGGFVNSREFKNTYGTLDDTGFVDLLYRNVLDRGADAKGLEGWLDFIDAGGSRAGVVRGFAQSAEFRAETAGELAAWVRGQGTDDVLTGGAGNDKMSGGLLSDAFVFSTSMRGHDTVVDLEAWDTLRFEGFGYTSDAEARANLYQQGANVIFADQAVGATFLDTTLAMFTDDMIQV